MATGGRKTHLQVIHEMMLYLVTGAASLINNPTVVSANQPSGVLGVLPAGAIISAIRLLTVGTAFDAATMTVALGTTPGGAQILAAQNVKPLGRIDVVPAPGAMGPFAADQPIYWTNTVGGANATGWCMIWAEYLPGVG